jgi:2-keto-4-pentenoate hydratase/2-oxohepta-3-ene-1,7-dioic acid hydratase in catechol pathway
MKLISFEFNGKGGYGVVTGNDATGYGIVDAGTRLGNRYPTLRSLLAADAVGELEPLAGRDADFSLTDVTQLPVIPNAEKIFCLGINYLSHIHEMKRDKPAHPWVFMRSNHCQVGSDEAMIRPKVSDWFDFEGELAVIIGKTAHHVLQPDAFDYVAGYSCFNDGTVRNYQRHSPLFTAGKNFYKSGSFGPWMVTRDEIADPTQLTLETRLNGEIMQSAEISDLCFDIPYLIEYLSSIGPLYPGDVIVTGTPGGVGFARDPYLWMKPGDTVEVEISSIGTLRNTIIGE